MYNWYVRLVMIATLLALTVVVLGAYVRLTDAGLGCPDWPGCYGSLILPGEAEERAVALPMYIVRGRVPSERS